MKLSRRAILSGFPVSMSLLAFNRAALAGTVVKISLWDKGEASMDAMDTLMPMGLAMPGAGMDMATMGITADPAEIPAGEVTFTAVNESQEFYHSLAIAPVADLSKELPYLVEDRMVDEEAAGTIARMKELRPQTSGSATFDLQPGTYILYCNIAGHYVMGMWTLLKVTG
jgi:uncharacterized cupredoxin-like copper-binding protein